MWPAVSCLALVLGQSPVAVSPPTAGPMVPSAAPGLGAPRTGPSGSYLIGEAKGADGAAGPRVEIYCPQEGDLVFFDKHSRFCQVMYFLAGSHSPYHVAIVVKRPDGSPALLEATFGRYGTSVGKVPTSHVHLENVLEGMASFENGDIYVRRIKVPLTPERSAALTQFAVAQEGKKFAFARMVQEGTLLCARGPLKNVLGRTELDHKTWICSELTVAAGTVAGLFDPKIHHSNVILAAELFDDRHYDLSALWMPAVSWSKSSAAAPVSN
jgi:hypothetical protein